MIYAPILGGIVAFSSFLAYERRAAQPMLKLSYSIANTRRSPKMSPSDPPIKISDDNASRYAFDTHCWVRQPASEIPLDRGQSHADDRPVERRHRRPENRRHERQPLGPRHDASGPLLGAG